MDQKEVDVTTDVMTKAVSANEIKNNSITIFDGTLSQTKQNGENVFISETDMESKLTNRFDDADYYGN